VYIYIYTYVYICIYIHMYIQVSHYLPPKPSTPMSSIYAYIYIYVHTYVYIGTPLFAPETLHPYVLRLLMTLIPSAALSNNHNFISNISFNISNILDNIPSSSNGNPDNPNTGVSLLGNLISDHILIWRNIGNKSIEDVYSGSSAQQRIDHMEHVYDVLG
jgi:hypothetical protein